MRWVLKVLYRNDQQAIGIKSAGNEFPSVNLSNCSCRIGLDAPNASTEVFTWASTTELDVLFIRIIPLRIGLKFTDEVCAGWDLGDLGDLGGLSGEVQMRTDVIDVAFIGVIGFIAFVPTDDQGQK